MLDDRDNAACSPQAFFIRSWILCTKGIVEMDDSSVRKRMASEEGVFVLWRCRVQLLYGDECGHKACDCVFQVLEVIGESS